MKEEIEYCDMTCTLDVQVDSDVSGKFYDITLDKVECLDEDVTEMLDQENLDKIQRRHDLDEDLTVLEHFLLDLNMNIEDVRTGAIEKYVEENPLY